MKRLSEEKFAGIPPLFEYLRRRYTREVNIPSLNIGIGVGERSLLDGYFKRVLAYRGLHYKIREIGFNLYHVEIGKKLVLPFYVVKSNEPYYLFMSDNNKSKSVFKTFIRNAKPYFEYPIFFQEDLFDVLDLFVRKYGSLTFVEGTLKSKKKTQREWEKERFEYNRNTLKGIASNVRGRWTSIVVLSEKLNMKFRLYEDGWITLYYGDFEILYNTIVKRLLNKADTRIKMFNEVEQYASRDFGFKYLVLKNYEPFDMKTINKIKNDISKKYVSSIIHSGNPYLHMELLDRRDYSAISLFASKNKIRIIPIKSVSSASLVELTSILLGIVPTLEIKIEG